jgi:hypothetical protein
LATSILEDEVHGERVERTAELLLKVASLSDEEVDDLLGHKEAQKIQKA